MARYPNALWDPISGSSGAYNADPFKIIHHTTEGDTYAGARAAYQADQSDPHFTVEGEKIYQHIDTSLAARALKNDPGGVETNRSSAVQIELVGYAGRPKDPAGLLSVARICRWIEETHSIPQAWPNGHPRPPLNGHDPGGHNRDPYNWAHVGGHYGHSQVPENTHWDPAYTEDEISIVTPNG
jgi:hypothetical protein